MEAISESKLLVSAACFKKKDLKRFLLFVESPYFNKHQPTIRLMKYLYDRWPNWESLSKPEIFCHVFPEEVEYRPFKISNVFSYLTALLEQFLAQRTFEKQGKQEIYTLRAAADLKMIKLFESNIRKLEKKLRDRTKQTTEGHYLRYEINYLQHLSQENLERKYGSDALISGLEHLDVWYVIKKMEYACEVLSMAKLSKVNIKRLWYTSIANSVEENWAFFADFPLVVVYHKCLMTLVLEEDQSIYFELRKYTLQHEEKFSKNDLKNIYKYILNYAIIRSNRDDRFFTRETFEIYKKLIDMNLVLADGEIKQVTYANIIALGCMLEELEWTKAFAERYRNYLPQESRENAHNHNQAMIFFHEKEYDKALHHIHLVAYSNIFYQLTARFLQIKIYYQMKEDRLLDSAMESLRIFIIRQKKLPKNKKRAGLNFIKFINRLSQLSFAAKPAAEDLRQLKLDIESETEDILQKKWLIGKIQKEIESSAIND